jgi:hypothetical protein
VFPRFPDVVPAPESSDPSDGPFQVNLSDPQQMIELIPYWLGFHPQASLVALLYVDRVLDLAVRFDLPNTNEPVEDLWQQIAPVMASLRPDAVSLISYADAAGVEIVTQLARTAPAPVMDVLRVHEGRWWCLACTDPKCASTPWGSPLVPQPQVAAPLIVRAGVAVAPSRSALNACLAPAPNSVRERVTNALLRSEREQFSPATAYAELSAARQARTQGPRALTDAEAARLLRAAAQPRVRDACSDWSDEAAWWLWTDLLPLAPSSHVPVVAALLAGAAYQRGNTPMADIAARHALAGTESDDLPQVILYALYALYPPQAFENACRRRAALARDQINATTSPTDLDI